MKKILLYFSVFAIGLALMALFSLMSLASYSSEPRDPEDIMNLIATASCTFESTIKVSGGTTDVYPLYMGVSEECKNNQVRR